jgi:hypothetical protein
MTMSDLLTEPVRGEGEFQRLVNAFVDEFRRAGDAERRAMVTAGPSRRCPGEGMTRRNFGSIDVEAERVRRAVAGVARDGDRVVAGLDLPRPGLADGEGAEREGDGDAA